MNVIERSKEKVEVTDADCELLAPLPPSAESDLDDVVISDVTVSPVDRVDEAEREGVSDRLSALASPPMMAMVSGRLRNKPKGYGNGNDFFQCLFFSIFSF